MVVWLVQILVLCQVTEGFALGDGHGSPRLLRVLRQLFLKESIYRLR